MGLFKFKTACVGLASIVAATSIFADAVLDATFDDNQNEFEYYWYYYDDNAGVGENDRPQAAPEAKPSVIDVDFTEEERHAFDDAADTWKIKKYKFTTTNSLGKNCAMVPFTFGDVWPTSYGEGAPFVGVGSMLTEDGAAIDLTGVTSITFAIKSRVNDLTVNCKLQTLEIDEFSDKPGDELTGKEFGYYGKTVTVTAGDWQLVTVDIEDLDRPTWSQKIAFDITTCTKLAWEILYDENVTSDTLDIADVSFVGTYVFVSPSTWVKEEAAYPTTGLFANFDLIPYNESPIGTYWYAYNDAEISGTSTVTETFAVVNPETGRLNIQFTEGTGSAGDGTNFAGRGAALEYLLGDPIPKDTISISGFVGVGVNLYDSAEATYFDATDAAANHVVTDIFFEYYTDAGAKNITMEISDKNDVGDALAPTRKDSRGDGIVWYKNFPATNGVWKKVKLPLDSLITHKNWQGYVDIPLDKKNLAKLQWKVQGGKGTNGLFAIDNIYLVGADFGVPVMKPLMSSKKSNGTFSIAANHNFVNVQWDGASALKSGKINLVNLKGIVMASTGIGAATTANLSATKIPTGMYFVNINAVDSKNQKVVRNLPVNIVK